MSDAEAEAEAQRRFGDHGRISALRRAKGAAQGASGSASPSGSPSGCRTCDSPRGTSARRRRSAPIAVLTLALGIGANTAVFSVVHHLLIAPLPYPNGNRIVRAARDRRRAAFIGGLASMAAERAATPPARVASTRGPRAHARSR